MTDLERNEFREFNGRMIEELCEIGEKIVDAYAQDIRRIALRQTANEVVSGLPRWRWQQFDAAKDYHE